MEQESREIQTLIEKEKPFLWTQALGLAETHEDAEDLYQDTLMKVCRYISSFQPDTNFRAWARKIMVNNHINLHRRDRFAMTLDDDFSTGAFDGKVLDTSEMSAPAHTDNPEKLFFHRHIDKKLMGIFYSLPDDSRIVFSLYHFEGYTYEEISRAIRIPVGTVKSRIFRARKYFGDKLKPVRGKFTGAAGRRPWEGS